MQRSGIIDNIALGILGNGDKEGTNADRIKEVMSTLLNLLITHSLIYNTKGPGGGESPIKGELASLAGRFHYLGNWKGCLTKKKKKE